MATPFSMNPLKKVIVSQSTIILSPIVIIAISSSSDLFTDFLKVTEVVIDLLVVTSV